MEAYDLDKLKEQKTRLEESIKTIETALKDEQKKLARTEMMIEDAEKIMNAHGLQACKRGDAEHYWIIDERHKDGFHRGKWFKRHCKNCGETQWNGHGPRR